MNNKMAIKTYLPTIESKKQTNQTRRTKQNHGYGEHFDGCQMGGSYGGVGEDGRTHRQRAG